METFQITIIPYYIKTKKGSISPTLEEIDTFMMSNYEDGKQYDTMIEDLYKYNHFDYTTKPYDIQYIPGGFITFKIGNRITFYKFRKVNGKEIREDIEEFLSKEQILQGLLDESLEDGAWEGGNFVYQVDNEEHGVFDFRKPKCIRIVKIE